MGLLSGGEMLRRKPRRAIWLQGPQCCSWLFSYTFIWPLPSIWEGSRTEKCWSPNFLSALFGLYFKPHNRMLEKDGQKGICASAVWYLHSCEKACFKCQICPFLCCVISSPSLSFFPSLHPFYLCTQLLSLAFRLSQFPLSCAFLPVGFYVHVPDPNPGGLGRCHGPDPGGCRSYVGSSSSHLLHPLPSVRYLGEEHTLLF